MSEPIDAEEMGRAWLAAAAGGGLPEPTRNRWQPMRVGIVDLWEYDDAEFWFADGRLVLRGGNGAGKTKVLELTTLMLLRGEISPSVLDPFGSQHRTMRFNLLPTGEGDDPRAPADSGMGYAWAEFGRRDEGTGESRFLVCGMGASARRGSGTAGVSTWHFITGLRPGRDFTLRAAGRSIEQKDLRKIDGVTVPGSAAAYRARLAEDLFGLSVESYDNLTDLLKQLRKPKLGERLNPTSLAETLREALPPLAGNEVTQLAEGWEHLELLRRAVEQTEQAAEAVALFVRSGWKPWARIVLRRRCDEFANATTVLDNTTRDRSRAERELETARSQVRHAEAELATSSQERQDRQTALRVLLESESYGDAVSAAGRVEELRRAVADLGRQLDRGRARLDRERAAAERARAAAREATSAASAAGEKVMVACDAVSAAAKPAGLAESTARHLPERDVEAIAADHAVRTERFGRLRLLHDEHGAADHDVELSEHAVLRAKEELATAQAEEAAAHGDVKRGVEALCEAIRGWADASAVACPAPDVVAQWCDLAADLTIIDAAAGAARPGPSPTERMGRHVAAVHRELAGHRETISLQRDPLARRRQEVRAELDEVRSSTDSPPVAPVLWRRRDRPALDAGMGAPLWRLVNPVGDVDADRLARVEAALAASGLLDGWITPDGTLSTVDGDLVADVQLRPGSPCGRSSLLAVLTPDTAGGVGIETVRRLLGGIGWLETAAPDVPGDWLAADGSWRVGGITGRATPVAPASYLGAAARAAARQREILRLEGELSDLDGRISKLDAELDRADRALGRLEGEEQTIPTAVERKVTLAVATLADRVWRRGLREEFLEQERRRHEENLSRRDSAWARFADYAAEHRFGRDDLDGQEASLREFRTRLTELDGALEILAARQEALDAAEQILDQHEQAHRAADDEVADLADEQRQAGVRLAAAQDALGADLREHLERRDRLDAELGLLEDRIDQLNRKLGDAKALAARAEEVLDRYESQRADAERVRDAAMAALWTAVDRGLADPLGLAVPERRTVQSAREFAAATRREIIVPAQANDEDRAWRRCYTRLEELRQGLLPNRDARVADDDDVEDVPGIQRVLVLTDQASGWQPPHLAADALAARAREQRESYDVEQQRVLTTLLGSTFIEHLKDRLDYTARTFAGINAHLAGHPTRHGHTVRVVCEPDPSRPDAGAVVAALGRGYQELSTQKQDMVRAFLAERIEEARREAASDGAADWKEHLGRALDYRRWLRLSLQYRPGAGSAWRVFDAARHAAKSGGEKVVLLSQPLFAAAVVAYGAAGPHAPRWVWLDEAMTGVDATVKASFMGLTVDFELDVMLTAHDEWCTYPTVPAVAVYDLARQEHLPGVDVLPYLWCGGSLTQVPVERLGVSPAGETAGGPRVADRDAGDDGDDSG